MTKELQTISRKVELARKRRDVFVEFHSKARKMELQMIYEIWAHKDYTLMGFKNFQDYCEAPVESGGLDISRSWATQQVLVYKKYSIELGVPYEEMLEVSFRKLYELIDKATPQNVHKLIAMAKDTSLEDVQLYGKETVNCQHRGIREDNQEWWTKCPACKSFIKRKFKELCGRK